MLAGTGPNASFTFESLNTSQKQLPRRDRSVSECSSVSISGSPRSNSAIEGFLEKRGAWLAGYSTRYIRVFSAGHLAYFLTDKASQPRGVIQLRPSGKTASPVHAPADEEQGLFAFSVHAAAGTRVFLFRCKSAD